MRIGKVPAVIRAHERAGNAVMLWSPPGVGKSSIIGQMSAEDGVGNVDIRLALLNPVDLRGIPVVRGDKVEWVPPVFLVKQGPCRFFLDEINVSPQAVQASAYQWTLDYRIGEWKMDRTKDKSGRPAQTIIAAGNRATDAAFVQQMPAPLRNRVAHIEVEPHLDDWKDWALNNNVDPLVVNFLTFTSRVGSGIKGMEEAKYGLLFFFDPKQHTQGFPTPRSWAQVSRLIEVEPSFKTNTEVIGGMVGQAVAAKFTAYCKIADKVPDAKSVVIGGDMSVKPPAADKDPSALYAYCGALTSELIRIEDKAIRTKGAENVSAYLAKWFKDNAEFAVLTMKDFGRTQQYKDIYRNVIVTPAWREFTKAFGSLME